MTPPAPGEDEGVLVEVETASLCCATRDAVFPMYPRFRRFECKVFLTDALGYFGVPPTDA